MHILLPLLMITSTLSADHAVEGNAQSTVRVVIYEDLQCGDCAKFRAMLDAHLVTKYGGQVAFEHRDFPLPKHTWSRRAAMAARFFDAQNPKLGIEFRRQVLAGFPTIQPDDLATWIAAFARQFAVDPVKAVAAISSPSLAALVEQDLADGVARGIVRTPTVLVDGEPFVETFTVEAISQAIEAAVAASRKP